MVRYAAAQIENLCPQVINAARILAARPRSKVAQENMDVFRDAWENQVRILTEAVDDITTIDDFLAVSGMIFLFCTDQVCHGMRSDSELPCRSQWPRGLRRRSAAALLLGSWVRIPSRGIHICLLCIVR